MCGGEALGGRGIPGLVTGDGVDDAFGLLEVQSATWRRKWLSYSEKRWTCQRRHVPSSRIRFWTAWTAAVTRTRKSVGEKEIALRLREIDSGASELIGWDAAKLRLSSRLDE